MNLNALISKFVTPECFSRGSSHECLDSRQKHSGMTGQSTIEFTFAMIVIMFLIYGMVQVFRWAGMDLAQRRFAQDSSITTTNLLNGDPAAQLNSDIDSVLPLAAVYHGSITNGNTAQ